MKRGIKMGLIALGVGALVAFAANRGGARGDAGKGEGKGGDEGKMSLKAHIGVNMMGLGILGAMLAIAYPFLAMFLADVFEIHWRSYSVAGSIFLACAGFSVAAFGGEIMTRERRAANGRDRKGNG